jgi:type VI secretion system protein ImpB
VADRNFLEFDMDNFDQRMGAIEPGRAFHVDNKLDPEAGREARGQSPLQEDGGFRPGAVARQVPSVARLLEAREQLANLLRYMDGKVAAEDQLKALLRDPQLMAAVRDRISDRTAKAEDENQG